MSIVKDIFRRVHYSVAKTIVPVSPSRSVNIGVPEIATPTLGHFARSDFSLTRIPEASVGLLYGQPKCHEIEIGHLERNRCLALPFSFIPSRSHIVSLLEKPTVLDCLQWKSVRTGIISSSEYYFPITPNGLMPLLEMPQISSHSLEIVTPNKFISNGNFVPLVVVQVFECLAMLQQATRISENLFKPLGKARADGKAYRKADMWVWDPTQGFSVKQGDATRAGQIANDGTYRKSYNETRGSDGTRRRQGMTVWDLLFPLLQPPPFDLASLEQVFLPAELLPHQPEGVHFLASREAALLGDGVQTGKTIQSVVAMKLLFQTGKIDSALIVCPIPLLLHWQKQLEKWAPELWQGLTIVRSTNKEERRVMWRMPAHVYATNYETIVTDIEEIVSVRGEKGFGLIIADEIQRIKNVGTATAQKLKQIAQNGCKYRWGLSATPIENAVEDLVSIFEFLKPGLLRRDLESEDSAKRKIAPFFLRRRTADVAKHFREPRHDSYFVEMEGSQLEAYDQAFRASVAELKRLGEHVTLTHALAKLQALKQLCNVHLPTGSSAKVDWLLDQLEQIKANGDKVLLFTQYIESGRDFLSERLAKFGCVNYGEATGDRQRRSYVETFLNDPSKAIFIANPKVAGVGLPDLKVANYVMHFDHWWNPAVEEQANGRILGIGQKKDAFIVHLWVENSIEGRIQAILSRKRDLFGRVIDAQSNVDGTGLTEEELFALFDLKAPPKKPRITAEKAETGQRYNYSTALKPQQLSPLEFEDLVARVFSKQGYLVQMTKQTRDGGIDVIAIRDHPTGRDKLAIQCKRQENPVGRPELQKLLGVITADPSYSAGVVVTSSTFSADARQFAEMNARLKLVDKNSLAQLLAQYRIPVKEPNHG